ncbi:14463_t:CDS:2 [Gigaspora margarita]|uniref:14463_t:CDS:1 n=1 Tax=Gigaspora margarita TaxID=4874 RepID=A0ABN7VHV1_GIGMA|nr:14463_t:CDS:2 [Gigaspora margarita]
MPVSEELRYFRLETNTDNVRGIWAIAVFCKKNFLCKNLNCLSRFCCSKFGYSIGKQSTLCADPNIFRLALENVTSEEKINEFVVRWANYSCTGDSSNKSYPGKHSSKNIRVDTLSPISQDIHKFPRSWKGDILAALSFLLNCVRFPVIQKHYIVEKVEGDAVVMAAEVMKDLLRHVIYYG